MGTIRAIWEEVIGLFVDDGSLAVALLVWCGVVGSVRILAPGLPAAIAGTVLSVGCMAILLANVVRAATIRAANG